MPPLLGGTTLLQANRLVRVSATLRLSGTVT